MLECVKLTFLSYAPEYLLRTYSIYLMCQTKIIILFFSPEVLHCNALCVTEVLQPVPCVWVKKGRGAWPRFLYSPDMHKINVHLTRDKRGSLQRG